MDLYNFNFNLFTIIIIKMSTFLFRNTRRLLKRYIYELKIKDLRIWLIIINEYNIVYTIASYRSLPG